MTEFCIEIAGHAVLVLAKYDSTRIFCSDYLCNSAPDFSVKITEPDIVFEREKSAQEDRREGRTLRNFSDAYLETIAVQRKIAEVLFDYDILLLHGSVVAMDGQAYLFTAKSGTGKSTHTRLWKQVFDNRAVMVDDDKPFVRMEKDRAMVHGTPWNGKHRIGSNICVPLRAVCILERGTENMISRITPREALFMLLQQSNRPLNLERLPKYMELIDQLTTRTNFYRMTCNMDPQAAIIAYEAMRG